MTARVLTVEELQAKSMPFVLPSALSRYNLPVGAVVRIGLEEARYGGCVYEPAWVRVEKLHWVGGELYYQGQVRSRIILLRGITFGSHLMFQPDHIFSIEEDPIP